MFFLFFFFFLDKYRIVFMIADCILYSPDSHSFDRLLLVYKRGSLKALPKMSQRFESEFKSTKENNQIFFKKKKNNNNK